MRLDKEEPSASETQLALLTNLLPQCTVFEGDPSKLPVLQGYNNLLDDEETLATFETIDTYLKQKLGERNPGSGRLPERRC